MSEQGLSLQPSLLSIIDNQSKVYLLTSVLLFVYGYNTIDLCQIIAIMI